MINSKLPCQTNVDSFPTEVSACSSPYGYSFCVSGSKINKQNTHITNPRQAFAEICQKEGKSTEKIMETSTTWKY